MKKYLKISGYIFILIFVFCSCNQEQKKYNQAKDSESTIELESFITNYPSSVYVDSAKILIEKLIWQETLLENSLNSYEDYLSSYPNGQYVEKVQEQLITKKESLKLALETFMLAQQTSNKSKQERLYSKTDSLFKLANFTEFILDVFKYPSKNLNFDSEKTLSEFIEMPFTTTRYLYGSPATSYFDFVLSDESINKYIYYKIMLASAGVTRITLSIDLIRNGRVVSTINGNAFLVNSEYYLDQIGFILNDKINSLPKDKIRFKITASGSNYGMSCDNFISYIKVGIPIDTLNSTILSERKKAITWSISNSKWSHPSGAVLDFIAQLDYCVLNGKNGKWNFGWGTQKDNKAYQVSWKNNALSIQKLTKEKANLIGIKENDMSVLIE